MATKSYTSNKRRANNNAKPKKVSRVRSRISVTPLIIAFAITVVGATSISIGNAVQEFAQWNVICGSSHFGADDPIIYPGQPGKSHMHAFFGNTSTNAHTTTTSLLSKSPSSCGRNMGSKDLSAYWVPEMYKKNADGSSTMVGTGNQRMTIYYRRVGVSSGPLVKPIPQGLRMIAGNPVATAPQSHAVVYWQCGVGGPEYDSIPTCSSTDPVRADIMFPSCWDGKNLDSSNHRSHMAYPATSGACPGTHPVSLPQINIEVWYDGIKGGPSYYLASGGPYTLHGDFFAAWDNQTQNALIAKCMNSTHDCAGIHLSDDGSTLFVPDYDPSPISIVLGAYSTSSPWDGTKLQTPAPVTSPQPSHSSTSHATPTTTSKPTTTSSPAGELAITPTTANLTNEEARAQAEAAEMVSTPEEQYAKNSGTFAKTLQSVWLQKIGFLLIAGGIALGIGIWLAYRYFMNKQRLPY